MKVSIITIIIVGALLALLFIIYSQNRKLRKVNLAKIEKLNQDYKDAKAKTLKLEQEKRDTISYFEAIIKKDESKIVEKKEVIEVLEEELVEGLTCEEELRILKPLHFEYKELVLFLEDNLQYRDRIIEEQGMVLSLKEQTIINCESLNKSLNKELKRLSRKQKISGGWNKILTAVAGTAIIVAVLK